MENVKTELVCAYAWPIKLILMNWICERIIAPSHFKGSICEILSLQTCFWMSNIACVWNKRLKKDGMYVGKVYSERNRVTINTTFQRRGKCLAVYPRPFSSTFGIAGPVMAWLNEVAVGREGSTLTWWAVTPSPPFLTPCGKWRCAPGGV